MNNPTPDIPWVWTPSLTIAVIGSVLFLLATVIGLLIWLRINRERSRDARDARETRRFQHSPRIGDNAGYELQPGVWMVGEVVRVDTTNVIKDGPGVVLAIPLHTPNGIEWSRGIWSTRRLRWFPPDTPLGRHEVTDR